jgi:hypothetical protein
MSLCPLRFAAFVYPDSQGLIRRIFVEHVLAQRKKVAFGPDHIRALAFADNKKVVRKCRKASRRGGLALSCHLPELRECRVFICKREPVHAPGIRFWINLGRFYKPTVDLKTIASADANYLVTNTRLSTSGPGLFVYCSIPFAGDLPVLEPAMSEPNGNGLQECPFLLQASTVARVLMS